MHFFSGVLLFVCHVAENWRENHPRTMDEGQGLMPADGAVLRRPGHLGREDGKVGGGEDKDAVVAPPSTAWKSRFAVVGSRIVSPFLPLALAIGPVMIAAAMGIVVMMPRR